MSVFLLIGGATVDFYAYTPNLQMLRIGTNAPKQLMCLPFGSKTTLADLHVHPGGSAANSAVALRQLGSSSKLVAAVGSDPMGKLLLSNLAHHGVSTQWVKVIAGKKTSMSIVLLAPGGEKSLLTYRGANDSLSAKHLPAQAVKEADVVLFTSLPSAENFGLFTTALKEAEKLGKRVVFAPSITMLATMQKNLAKMHERFDLTIMNKEEAIAYTGETTIIRAIRRLPGKARVVTDAENGAYAYASGKLLHVPAAKVKTVDTTGAGDAFTAGFTHYYFEEFGNNCVDCDPSRSSPAAGAHAAAYALRFASAVAGIKLEHEGAHFTKRHEDVVRFLARHSELIVDCRSN